MNSMSNAYQQPYQNMSYQQYVSTASNDISMVIELK